MKTFSKTNVIITSQLTNHCIPESVLFPHFPSSLTVPFIVQTQSEVSGISHQMEKNWCASICLKRNMAGGRNWLEVGTGGLIRSPAGIGRDCFFLGSRLGRTAQGSKGNPWPVPLPLPGLEGVGEAPTWGTWSPTLPTGWTAMPPRAEAGSAHQGLPMTQCLKGICTLLLICASVTLMVLLKTVLGGSL